jgi:polyhydroxybutyrate depolymerase
MFGELPKLLGKEFIIGHLLPAALFVLAFWGALYHFDLSIPALEAHVTDLTTGTTLLSFASWLLGIVLVASNNAIYKLFEGYGYLNPGRLLCERMGSVLTFKQLLLYAMSRVAFSGIAISLLACGLVLLAGDVGAQDGSPTGTFRERLKQRWIKAQQDKPAPESSANTTSTIDKPGDYTFSIVHDGLTRLYRVHIPQRYSPATPAPLVVAFHGGGGDMNYMSTDKYYGLISKSEAKGFVVVFPNGFSKLNSGKFATWDAGTCCAGARDQNVDDVGFVRKIIGNLIHQLSIDRNQIYATGMSNGGMMTYRLACEMADTFKAVASVAGTDNTTNCTPKAPISILHIHAKNDDHVLYNGGAGKKFRDMSKVSDFTSVPATIAKWVKLNSCNPTPQRVLITPGAYCDKYSHCQGNVAVQLCVTETGGHSWPGGTKNRGDEPPSQAISADDVMWTFFTSTQNQNPPKMQ